jgi:hypothetical protein
MSSLVGGGAATARDEFIDLICQDEDLLRAEFEELVADFWSTPPQPPPPAPPRPTRPPRRPTRVIDDRSPVSARGQVPELRWNRQRSPPHGDTRKGR